MKHCTYDFPNCKKEAVYEMIVKEFRIRNYFFCEKHLILAKRNAKRLGIPMKNIIIKRIGIEKVVFT